MESITQEEVQEMRKVLSQFYGPIANEWTINFGVYEVLGRLITESKRCTQAMHLVPRPWNLSNPIKWAHRQVRQAIVRYLRTSEGQYYVICMKAAARNYRTEFERARLGL